MRISLEWLSDFVDVPDVTTLVEGLTKAGVEVEAVHDPASAVTGVVVGLVESVEPHPKADKVRITHVSDGTAKFLVVCGAPNVAVGQKVAFAKIGAKLPAFDITQRNIRGVDSFGMLCGKSELGLEAKSDGIWVLPETVEVGQPLWSQVSSGAAIELSVTANRPDLLSHYGVAREVAAFSGKRMKIPTWRVTEKGGPSAQAVRVLVDDNKGCKRFVARTLSNVKVGPSPDWIRERLEAVGQRAINNVVDATNYVLMELGQPLHAYDLAHIAAESGLPTLRARRAAAGETLKTLDGVDRKLDADDLVIADAVKPLGIAGVMGGATSEVTEATVNVVLEAAWFEPVSVRRTAKRHGLHTEASKRFERGADPGITARAVDRCAQLLTEMGAGDVGKGAVEVAVKGEPAREINVRLQKVQRLLGIELEAEDVVKLLEPLEIRCSARNESSLRFSPPTFRPDLAIEVDIIEEIARRHGYDNFPEHVPDAGGTFRFEARPELPSDKARKVLLPSGLSEVVTYGFASPSRYSGHLARAGEVVRLLNPIGEELSALRTTLVPSLLEVAALNARQGQKNVKIFEVGSTFRAAKGSGRVVKTVIADRQAEADAREVHLIDERPEVGLLMMGGRYDGRWHEHGEQLDFGDLAGVIDSVVESFEPAQPLQRVPAVLAGYHPHAAAELRIGETFIGWMGQLHPEVVAAAGLSGAVFAAELLLEPLASLPKRAIVHRELPKFPGTRRDLAIIAERTVSAESLRAFIADKAGGAMGKDVVEKVRLFDVYAGKPIPETHVSLAFAIDYRNRERTLTDTEVNTAFEELQAQVKQTFAVEIRS